MADIIEITAYINPVLSEEAHIHTTEQHQLYVTPAKEVSGFINQVYAHTNFITELSEHSVEL